MKKVISILLVVAIVLMLPVSTMAANSPTVYSDEVYTTLGESFTVPIKLKNNSGIMGFKITVSYSPDVLDVVSIKKGDLLKDGNFNTNFGLSDTHFDIIWNNTENIKGDGTIFILEAKTKQKFKSNAKISLSYSQEDTFNESWEDVKLDCKSVTVKKSDETSTTVNQSEKEETTLQSVNFQMPDSKQILSAIDNAFEETDYSSVYEAAKYDEFIDEVNKNISEAVGDKENNTWIPDYNTFTQMYEDSYESEFFNTVTQYDSAKVNEAIATVMQKMGVSEITDLPEEDQEKFIKKVKKEFEKADLEIPDIEKDVDTDEAMKLIKQTYGLSTGGVPQKVEINENASNKNIVIWLIIVIAVVLIVAVLTILIIKIKKKKSEGKKA